MIKKFQLNRVRYKVDTEALQGFDLVVGHVLFFRRRVFSGHWRRSRLERYEDYIVEIIKDSYGAEKGQHTFTLGVIRAFDKSNDRAKGEKIIIKGRNLYPYCKILVDPEDVHERRSEKHQRAREYKFY